MSVGSQHSNPSIVVVIPAYNEASVLEETIRQLLNASYTVVVVDDGSTPSLKERLHPFSIHYLRHRVNLGQGAALQTGFRYAQTLQPKVVISFDADGQHDPADIPALAAPILADEVDIVLGSRFLEKGSDSLPAARRKLLGIARLVNGLLTGLWLSDAHNGLRALGPKALEEINLQENRMAHASEILLEIRKHGWRRKEIGVNIRYTDYSKQKGQSGWDSIRIVFDLLLHKLFQ